MKLNLLASESTSSLLENRVISIAILIATLSVFIGAFMIYFSSRALELVKQETLNLEPQAAYAYRIAKQADEIVKSASVIERNIRLYQSLEKHNFAYTKLYKDVLDYVPGFFRLTELSAKPINKKDTLIKMVGVIKTYQQYADLMLVMMRMPGVSKVYRKGFDSKEKYVPGLIKEDQWGAPIKPGEKRMDLRSLPIEKQINARMVSPNASPLIPANQANQSDQTAVAPLSDDSEITLYVLVQGRNLQTPNPQLTLVNTKKENEG